MNRIFLSILLLVISFFNIKGQDLTQNIWGNILDRDTKIPLEGVNVVVVNSNPQKGAISDSKGYYSISNVLLGRVSLKFSLVGYKSCIMQNLELFSGKELNINIELEREVLAIDEVIVKASREKALNNLAPISARQISIDQTSSYAGSRNDISRIAANYPGVSNVNDGRNDIVIRGNSPNGLLWRLDGLDIPGPQHFSGIGSNGGFISMVNYNTIANSDFLTGAFPSEYGNATSGIFDLNFRNGNFRKREYMFQIGALGTEFMLEGPFSKNSEASYLINYRFSTTSILKALGLNLGYAGQADYQDAMFKFNIPTKKIGTFSFFGIGGNNVFKVLFKNSDNSTFNEVMTENNDTYYTSGMGAMGVSHLYHLNTKMFIKTTFGVTGKFENVNIDSISLPSNAAIPFFRSETSKEKLTIQTFLRYTINSRINSKTGIILDRNYFNLASYFRNIDGSIKQFDRNGIGEINLYRAYTHWQYKVLDNVTINTGVHFQYLNMNKTYSIEPRFGVNYQVTQNNTISLGYGHHEQMQTLHTYYVSTNTPSGVINTNKNLGFIRSQHFVIGDQVKLSSNSTLKVEGYYQYLYDLPIQGGRKSSYSMSNDGSTYITPTEDSLINKGTGRNYGIELSLEKLYNQGYYYLISTSLFDSKYKGSDGVLRNTAFNGNYILNFLLGKEFKIGEQSKIIFDIKTCYAGGRKYTPIDAEESKIQNKAVFIDNLAYSKKQNDYFRTDFKITYRLNRTKVMHDFFINIDNVFNTKNVFTQIYSVRTKQLEYVYQLGIFPTFQYKLYF
ncbi:MAG: TonB-dependent receptor [Bacteroidales bacterium]|nr:TonB-dependent receptor [Bacteroidales bacterium]